MVSNSLDFFFQAEDGIRDLVRSRGLGDVYKRQAQRSRDGPRGQGRPGLSPDHRSRRESGLWLPVLPVSYTHLTLPTSDLV